MTMPNPDLHRRLLTLDTHLDTAVHLPRPGWHFGDRHRLADDVAQLDLPRMEDGNLRGGFFVVYARQGPLDADGYADALSVTRQISDDIDAMLARYPDRIGAARTATDARRLHAEGRLIAFKSIENSYLIGEDLSLVEEFYHRGVRLAGPVHSKTNQLANSATDEKRWNGISQLGREWVGEMNRLGIAIDGSHASDDAFDAMMELSSAPLLLSHTGTRTRYDDERNIDDGRLRALASAGGVIGFTTIFLSDVNFTPRRLELFRLHGAIAELDPAAQEQLAHDWNRLDEEEPMWQAGFDDYIDGLLHVIDVAGIDHVCFGADWDGGGGIAGLRDVTDLPRVTRRLAERGFSESDLEKLWSGNLLRALDAVQDMAVA